jgi:hypothetical protein
VQQLTTLDFLCQASDSLLRMHSCDTVSALTILHIFACLAGEKFLSRHPVVPCIAAS